MTNYRKQNLCLVTAPKVNVWSDTVNVWRVDAPALPHVIAVTVKTTSVIQLEKKYFNRSEKKNCNSQLLKKSYSADVKILNAVFDTVNVFKLALVVLISVAAKTVEMTNYMIISLLKKTRFLFPIKLWLNIISYQHHSNHPDPKKS